jgi:hypothetical protein
MPSSAFTASEDSPIVCFVNVDQRPSWIIVSTISASPRREPARAFGRTYGACVMDSMPPATTISTSPARIIWSASAMAVVPDRQTLSTFSAGTSLGIPAAIEAWRAVTCPVPARITWPMTT